MIEGVSRAGRLMVTMAQWMGHWLPLQRTWIPGFHQHSHGGLQCSVTPVPGDLMLFFDLQRQQAHVWCKDMQVKHPYA